MAAGGKWTEERGSPELQEDMQPWRVPSARYLARKGYPDPSCVLTALHPSPQVQPGPILQADEVRAAPEVIQLWKCGRDPRAVRFPGFGFSPRMFK